MSGRFNSRAFPTGNWSLRSGVPVDARGRAVGVGNDPAVNAVFPDAYGYPPAGGAPASVPFRSATPAGYYQVRVDIYEAGAAYPAVTHLFTGRTRDEAWAYHDRHKQVDPFLRGCEDGGAFASMPGQNPVMCVARVSEGLAPDGRGYAAGAPMPGAGPYAPGRY